MDIYSKTPQTELAWAAGFFDGEGSTSMIRKNGIILAICQNHVEVLERFQQAVDAGTIYGPYPMKATGNLRWQFLASTKVAIVVLGKLWPYLSSEKRNQATLCLSTLTERLNGQPLGQPGRRKILPEGHGRTMYRAGCRCTECKLDKRLSRIKVL